MELLGTIVFISSIKMIVYYLALYFLVEKYSQITGKSVMESRNNKGRGASQTSIYNITSKSLYLCMNYSELLRIFMVVV